MRGKAGFTLLEAIIALAIASAGLLVVFEMMHQLVDGQRRHELAMRGAEMRRNALTLLQDLNPGVEETEPFGELAVGALALAWTGQAVSDATQGVGSPFGDGSYCVRLYRIMVSPAEGAEPREAEAFGTDALVVERMGWLQGECPATEQVE